MRIDGVLRAWEKTDYQKIENGVQNVRADRFQPASPLHGIYPETSSLESLMYSS
jgi:hypothetical protein